MIAHLRSRTLRQQAAMLASVLLLVTIGLCVLHGAFDCFEPSDQGMPLGLCAGMVGLLISPLLILRPGLAGRLRACIGEGVSLDLPGVLDRPPEFPALA